MKTKTISIHWSNNQINVIPQNKMRLIMSILICVIRYITQFALFFLASYGAFWLYLFSDQYLESSLSQLYTLPLIERSNMINNMIEIALISAGALTLLTYVIKNRFMIGTK